MAGRGRRGEWERGVGEGRGVGRGGGRGKERKSQQRENLSLRHRIS